MVSYPVNLSKYGLSPAGSRISPLAKTTFLRMSPQQGIVFGAVVQNGLDSPIFNRCLAVAEPTAPVPPVIITDIASSFHSSGGNIEADLSITRR